MNGIQSENHGIDCEIDRTSKSAGQVETGAAGNEDICALLSMVISDYLDKSHA